MKLGLIFVPGTGPQESRQTPCNGCPHNRQTPETPTGELIQIGAAGSLAFTQSLLNPPEPNEALRAAAERYKALEPAWSALGDMVDRDLA